MVQDFFIYNIFRMFLFQADNCKTQGIVISGKALSSVFPPPVLNSQGKEIPLTLTEKKLHNRMKKLVIIENNLSFSKGRGSVQTRVDMN